MPKTQKFGQKTENIEILAFGALFSDEVSMTSSGGVGYGMMTWRSEISPRGRVMWRTAQSNGGWGADVVLTGRDVELAWAGGIRRAVSGIIAPLTVRERFW